MNEMFVGEFEWVKLRSLDIGLIPAAREGRTQFMKRAIQEAATVEDLKPVLLRLIEEGRTS